MWNASFSRRFSRSLIGLSLLAILPGLSSCAAQQKKPDEIQMAHPASTQVALLNQTPGLLKYRFVHMPLASGEQLPPGQSAESRDLAWLELQPNGRVTIEALPGSSLTLRYVIEGQLRQQDIRLMEPVQLMVTAEGIESGRLQTAPPSIHFGR